MLSKVGRKYFFMVFNLKCLLRKLYLKFIGIKIGKDAKIYGKVIIGGDPWNIRIGDNSTINEGVFLDAHGKITIGDRCRISPYTQFHTTKLDYDYRKHVNLDIRIGDNVWIASSAIIGTGVSIGDNSIIGAGSLVTKNIPPDVIAFGSPAKVIKRIN
jgi:acetyltransferase-like isoleucine patch superfamily enzyme